MPAPPPSVSDSDSDDDGFLGQLKGLDSRLQQDMNIGDEALVAAAAAKAAKLAAHAAPVVEPEAPAVSTATAAPATASPGSPKSPVPPVPLAAANLIAGSASSRQGVSFRTGAANPSSAPSLRTGATKSAMRTGTSRRQPLPTNTEPSPAASSQAAATPAATKRGPVVKPVLLSSDDEEDDSFAAMLQSGDSRHALLQGSSNSSKANASPTTVALNNLGGGEGGPNDVGGAIGGSDKHGMLTHRLRSALPDSSDVRTALLKLDTQLAEFGTGGGGSGVAASSASSSSQDSDSNKNAKKVKIPIPTASDTEKALEGTRRAVRVVESVQENPARLRILTQASRGARTALDIATGDTAGRDVYFFQLVSHIRSQSPKPAGLNQLLLLLLDDAADGQGEQQGEQPGIISGSRKDVIKEISDKLKCRAALDGSVEAAAEATKEVLANLETDVARAVEESGSQEGLSELRTAVREARSVLTGLSAGTPASVAAAAQTIKTQSATGHVSFFKLAKTAGPGLLGGPKGQDEPDFSLLDPALYDYFVSTLQGERDTIEEDVSAIEKEVKAAAGVAAAGLAAAVLEDGSAPPEGSETAGAEDGAVENGDAAKRLKEARRAAWLLEVVQLSIEQRIIVDKAVCIRGFDDAKAVSRETRGLLERVRASRALDGLRADDPALFEESGSTEVAKKDGAEKKEGQTAHEGLLGDGRLLAGLMELNAVLSASQGGSVDVAREAHAQVRDWAMFGGDITTAASSSSPSSPSSPSSSTSPGAVGVDSHRALVPSKTDLQRLGDTISTLDPLSAAADGRSVLDAVRTMLLHAPSKVEEFENELLGKSLLSSSSLYFFRPQLTQNV